MFGALKLFLPALIPSWRFFDEIAPSPRIEYSLLKTAQDPDARWQEFRPRPERVAPLRMLCRLFWNPRWNESLFMVSCAERLMDHPTEHSRLEIVDRVRRDLGHSPATPFLQFRLVFLSRRGADIQKDIRFVSPVYPACENISA